MLVKKQNRMYTNKRKFVQGSGLIDGIGSYILENKDLIAKPLLGAVGNVGALALTEGSKYILNKILRNSTAETERSSPVQLDEKSKQIISELLHSRTGSGIKRF